MESIRNSKIFILVIAVVTAVMMLMPAKVFAASGTSSSINKDETVYVIQDADGTAKKTVVSDYLNNSQGYSILVDKTNLRDIQNVKGKESFTKGSNGTLTWNAKGHSIYYRGVTSAQAPITMNIKYYLNGDEILPSDLAGKSGNVKIKIDYNNNAKVGDVTVPFFVASTMILKDSKFSDVKINNGKILDDGDKQTVIGMAMPGLAESLGISSSKLDIPESLTVSAKVKDFSLDTIMTVAANNLFDNLDVSGVNSLKGLDSKINKLDSSAKALVSGSAKLAKGTATAESGSKTLASSSRTINSGAQQIYNGTAALASKVPALSSGVSQINSGASSLQSGLASYTGGVDQVSSGLSSYCTAIQGKIAQYTAAAKQYAAAGDSVHAAAASGAAQALSAVLNGSGTASDPGLSSVSKSLSTISSNSSALNTGAASLASGAAQLNSSVPALQNAVTQLKNGSYKLSGGTKKFAAGTQKLYVGEKKLKSGSAELSTGMSKFYNQGIAKIVSLYNGNVKTAVNNIQKVVNASKNYSTFTKLENGSRGDVKFLFRTDSIEK